MDKLWVITLNRWNEYVKRNWDTTLGTLLLHPSRDLLFHSQVLGSLMSLLLGLWRPCRILILYEMKESLDKRLDPVLNCLADISQRISSGLRLQNDSNMKVVWTTQRPFFIMKNWVDHVTQSERSYSPVVSLVSMLCQFPLTNPGILLS